MGKGKAVQLLGDAILAYENARVTEADKIPLDGYGNPQLHYWPASKNNGYKFANVPAMGTGELDKLYGTLTLPSYVKYYEVDPQDKFGHTSGVAGGVARIGGEILFEDGAWIINNKSGRYSKKNLDRTPEQLANAARLIMVTVNPSGSPWGEVRYRLAYGNADTQKEYQDSGKVKYLKPKKKQKPYLLVKVPE